MVKIGEILTLDNNKKFVVVSTTNYENNIYCYLAKLDNPNITNIYLIKEDNLIPVIDENLITELENIFVNNFAD